MTSTETYTSETCNGQTCLKVAVMAQQCLGPFPGAKDEVIGEAPSLAALLKLHLFT